MLNGCGSLFAVELCAVLFPDAFSSLSPDVLQWERCMTLTSLWEHSLTDPGLLLAAIDTAARIENPIIRGCAVSGACDRAISRVSRLYVVFVMAVDCGMGVFTVQHPESSGRAHSVQ